MNTKLDLPAPPPILVFKKMPLLVGTTTSTANKGITTDSSFFLHYHCESLCILLEFANSKRKNRTTRCIEKPDSVIKNGCSSKASVLRQQGILQIQLQALDLLMVRLACLLHSQERVVSRLDHE